MQFVPKEDASSQRPFDDDWRACLRAHYLHVVREVQAKEAPENNAITLRRVLIERAKFDEAEVESLYRQAIGAVEAHFVSTPEAEAAPMLSAPVEAEVVLGTAPEPPIPEAEAILETAPPEPPPIVDEAPEPPIPEVDAIPVEPLDIDPNDIESILASMDEDALLRELSEDEENAIMRAYEEGEATLTDVIESVDPEAEAPTPPAEQPEITMPSESTPTQLSMF